MGDRTLSPGCSVAATGHRPTQLGGGGARVRAAFVERGADRVGRDARVDAAAFASLALP